MNSDLAADESVMSDENLNKNGNEQTNEKSVLEEAQTETMETDQVYLFLWDVTINQG